MGRHLHFSDGLKIGVNSRVKLVAEKSLDCVATELAGWQADVVYDQQSGRFPLWPFIVIRRSAPAGRRDTPCSPQFTGRFLKGGLDCYWLVVIRQGVSIGLEVLRAFN